MIKSVLNRKYVSQPISIIQKRLLSQVALNISEQEESPVLIEGNKNTRALLFNRAEKLNCLTNPMLDMMFPRLKAWENSDNVDLVLLKGQGRAFCSGGDLKSGGGCSIAALSHFSVATENTVMRMPETRFGHFCDAGASFYLPRLNGNLGKYIALCNKALVAEDALFSGLATHFVPSKNLDYLEESLENLVKPTRDRINQTIERFSVKPGHIPLSSTLHGENRKIIETCFKFNSINEIIRALEKEGSRFSQDTIDQINKGSPLGSTVTFEYIKKGSKMTLAECLRMEHRGWQTSPYHPDFYNGIISTIVHKQKPKWSIPNFFAVNLEEDVEINYLYNNTRRKLNLSSEERDCYSKLQCREYGLPSDYEVDNARLQYDLKTNSDVISWFINNRNNKYGVQQEVEEIIRNNLNVPTVKNSSDTLSNFIAQ